MWSPEARSRAVDEFIEQLRDTWPDVTFVMANTPEEQMREIADAEVYVPTASVDVTGQRTVWKWKVEDKDIPAFIAYAKSIVADEVARGQGPLYQAVDTYVSRLVRATKGDTDIPGVTVYKDFTTAVR